MQQFLREKNKKIFTMQNIFQSNTVLYKLLFKLNILILILEELIVEIKEIDMDHSSPYHKEIKFIQLILYILSSC